ncbi:unnamed protein product, partial [Adineta ricciae]
MPISRLLLDRPSRKPDELDMIVDIVQQSFMLTNRAGSKVDEERKHSALTPTSPVSLMKKLKSDITDPLSSEEMPDYLLNDSRTFEQYMGESPS